MKKGDTVTVINNAMSGRMIIEGKAVVIEKLDDENRYLVQFAGEDEAPVERYVYPDAQTDPEDFVKVQNTELGFG